MRRLLIPDIVEHRLELGLERVRRGDGHGDSGSDASETRDQENGGGLRLDLEAEANEGAADAPGEL